MEEHTLFAVICLCFFALGIFTVNSEALMEGNIFFSENSEEVAEHIKNSSYFNSVAFQELLCVPNLACIDRKQNSTEHVKPSCCTCSCSQDCMATGNCCGNMNQSFPLRKQAGKFLTTNGELCTKPSITGGDSRLWTSSFLLVKSCSANYTGDAASRCLTNQNNSVEYLTPVYSDNTKHHYANVFCAQCNFQLYTNPWTPYLQCESFQDASDVLTATDNGNDLLQNIQDSKRCALIWKSGLKNEKKCFLDEDIVSECANEAKFFELKLSKLCEQEPYQPFESALHMYKNVYCFLCHERDILGGFYNCLQAREYDMLFVPFTALINVRTFQTSLKADEKHQYSFCPKGLTHNKLLGKCLNETCSPSRLKKGTECITVLENLDSVILDYRFKLAYKDSSAYPRTREEIYQDAIDLLPKNDLIMFECEVSITLSKPDDGLGVVAYVRMKKQVNYLIDIYKEIENYKKNIIESHQNIYFTADFDEVMLDPLPIDKLSLLTFSDGHGSCENSIAMHDLQYCDTITLPPDEFDVINGHLVTGDLMFSPSKFVLRPYSNGERGFAQICKDVYIYVTFSIVSKNKTYLKTKVHSDISESDETNKSHAKGNGSYFQFNIPVTPISILTAVCILCSLLSLVILIVVYIFLKQTSTVPSLNTVLLAANLLTAQCLFQFGIGQNDFEWLCVSIGILIHYFWLVYVCWTNVCSFHLFQTLVMNHWSTEDCSRVRVMKYALYCHVFPVLFIAVNILVSYFKYDIIGYGGFLCYISTPLMIGITFVLPLGLMTLINSLFFMVVIFKLKITGVQIATRYSSAKQKCSDLNIYLRMSTLTGVTWLFGFVFVWTGMEWLEYLFILLNASHGVFLMVSFVFTRRIYIMLKTKLMSSS